MLVNVPVGIRYPSNLQKITGAEFHGYPGAVDYVADRRARQAARAIHQTAPKDRARFHHH